MLKCFFSLMKHLQTRFFCIFWNQHCLRRCLLADSLLLPCLYSRIATFRGHCRQLSISWMVWKRWKEYVLLPTCSMCNLLLKTLLYKLVLVVKVGRELWKNPTGYLQWLFLCMLYVKKLHRLVHVVFVLVSLWAGRSGLTVSRLNTSKFRPIMNFLQPHEYEDCSTYIIQELKWNNKNQHFVHLSIDAQMTVYSDTERCQLTFVMCPQAWL